MNLSNPEILAESPSNYKRIFVIISSVPLSYYLSEVFLTNLITKVSWGIYRIIIMQKI